MEFSISTESYRALSNLFIRYSDKPWHVYVFSHFQSFGIGLGAVLGGLGGWVAYRNWNRSKEAEERVRKLKVKYPRQLLSNHFFVADTQKAKGKFYIFDKRDNTRHWVENQETMIDMGWIGENTEVEQAEFDRYQEDESLYTRRVI